MRTLITAIGVLAAFLAGPGAAAQDYPAGGVRVVQATADLTSEPGGAKATFRGAGFASKVSIRLSIDGQPRGSAISSELGTFAAELHLRGTGSVTLAGAGADRAAGLRVATVTVALPPSPSPPVPDRAIPTDAPAQAYTDLAAGLAFVLFGVIVVVVVRAVRQRPEPR